MAGYKEHAGTGRKCGECMALAAIYQRTRDLGRDVQECTETDAKAFGNMVYPAACACPEFTPSVAYQHVRATLAIVSWIKDTNKELARIRQQIDGAINK